jgi:DNA-binding IclR family transcriptional regulator
LNNIDDPAPVPGTAAFGKFMRVLQAVADATEPLSVADLAALVGLPRPTTYRIAAALMVEGLIAEGVVDGALVLGPRLINLAQRSWEQSDLRSVAQKHLIALRDALDETVHLAVRSGRGMVYIDKLESRRVVRMASRIGTGVALHSSSVGKAWLATLSEADFFTLLPRLGLVSHTPHTLTTVEALTEEITLTRGRGYSIDRQENELDICCYGHAIVNLAGQALGCISVSMPRYRFEEVSAVSVAHAMGQCAGGIAAAANEDRHAF